MRFYLPFSIFFCVFMHIMYTWTHACGGLKLMSAIILHCITPHSLRHVLWPKPILPPPFLPPKSRRPKLQSGCTPTTILMGSGDLNSGLHTGMSSTLTIEPHLQPLRLYFYENRCIFKIWKEVHQSSLTQAAFFSKTNKTFQGNPVMLFPMIQKIAIILST